MLLDDTLYHSKSLTHPYECNQFCSLMDKLHYSNEILLLWKTLDSRLGEVKRKRQMSTIFNIRKRKNLPLNPFLPLVSIGLFLAISLMISWTTYLSWKPASLGFISTWCVLDNIFNSSSSVLLPACMKKSNDHIHLRYQKFSSLVMKQKYEHPREIPL